MYALIGDVNFSSKMNSARVEVPFNVKCHKVEFFINYCNSNNLSPVFIGEVFDKNISVKNLYEALEFFTSLVTQKTIIFVSQDYRVKMLSKMINGTCISPDQFNSDQDMIHVATDRSYQTKPPYQFSVVGNSNAGNKIHNSGRGIIDVNLGSIYRSNVEERDVLTGFLDFNDSKINEVHFPLNVDCFTSDIFIKNNLIKSDDFANKLKEFDSLSSDDVMINTVMNSVLSEMGADEFEINTINELLEKSDTL
jgi:hypothetical protein